MKIDDIYFRATNGGVTFGGGEPALQSAFIEAFRAICGRDWRITLETSLNVSEEHIRRLIPIVDDYIIDIKYFDDRIYYSYTGAHNALVKSNLRLLIRHGLKDRITVRIPLIKGYNTHNDNAFSQRMLRKMGLTKFDRFEYVVNAPKKHTNFYKLAGLSIPMDLSEK